LKRLQATCAPWTRPACHGRAARPHRGKDKFIEDPLGASLDVIGANEYIGWYEGRPEDADTTAWHSAYQKPLIISEFGGGAKAAARCGNRTLDREYQASIYKHQLGMFNRIPQLRVESMDSDGLSLSGETAAWSAGGYNRKGLISEKGEKNRRSLSCRKLTVRYGRQT